MDKKRTVYLISSLLTLVISVSSLQASQLQNLSNTRALLELKGPIKTLKHNSDQYGKESFKFDNSGYLTKATFLYSNIEITHDETTEAEFSGNQRTYIYDADMKLLEIRKKPVNTTENMSEGIEFHYTKNKTPDSSLERRPLTSDVTRLFFNNGKLSKEVVVLMSEGKLLPEINRYAYQYNKDGLLELTTKQTLNTNAIQKILRNDKDFIIEERFRLNDTQESHEIKLLYQYLDFDEYNNWTKRFVVMSDSNEKEIQTREITYYNQP